MTFSQFARVLGVSPQAIAKARRSGRLRESVGVDEHGRAAIVDVELGRREWTANTARQVKTRKDPDPGVSVFRQGGRVVLAWGDLSNLDTTTCLVFAPTSAVSVGERLIAKGRQEGNDDVH